MSDEIDRLAQVAWEAYDDHRKSPRTRKAGPEFEDPEHELAVEWLETRAQIQEAERQQKSSATRSRVLLICASPRTDETCPSEMSKTFRIAQIAREVIDKAGKFDIDFLDLSNLAAEFGRVIYPCKACVSTAMPLCHWPCSCYPNHYMGQVNDWMNELYPRWVSAHGIMIITPVHWYQSPSTLKLMMDRLVCADGGNPDPTTTHGKTPEEAKALELKGWDYPRHLAGRMFSIVVHGDAEGAESLRQALHAWLCDMDLIPAWRVGRSGPLYRILRAVRYESRIARSRRSIHGRNPQCGAGAHASDRRYEERQYSPRTGYQRAASEIDCRSYRFVMSSKSLALSEVEWVETSLIVNIKRFLNCASLRSK